jgi:hypothetical protein
VQIIQVRTLAPPPNPIPSPTISAALRAGHYGAPVTIRDGLFGAGPWQVRLAGAR